MTALYSVFGLVLSCNTPLPRLRAETAARVEGLEDQRVAVELGSVPFELPTERVAGWDVRFASQLTDSEGTPVLRIWQNSDGTIYRLYYSDATEFFVDQEGRRLWGRWAAPNTLEDTATYLLGPVLGIVLRLRGIISLHASAVVIDGGAVALSGTAGVGKSTTAAAFAQRGYPVLSDDISALHPDGNHFYVQSDCPLLRLWPDSSAMLYGSREALPRLSMSWEKRFMDLEKHGYQAERSPRPLAAIYLLDGDPVAGDVPEIKPLKGRAGFISLVSNSYAGVLDMWMRENEFEVIGKIVEQIPVRRLHRPENGLPPLEVCEFLAADFRRNRDQARVAQTTPAKATAPQTTSKAN